MKLLFVGESWMGSCARSIKEGLRNAADPDADQIDEVNEDLFMPAARAKWLRAVNKVLAPAYRRELAHAILKKCSDERPDAMLVYKGSSLGRELIQQVKVRGVLTLNIFPDYSPHAYGPRLRSSVGEYDLIVSTKPFHPQLWREFYGYGNECVFVPHGYDPQVHLRSKPQDGFDFDVGMVATWRPEYQSMMLDLAPRLPPGLKVAIAGNGWKERAQDYPPHWVFPGGIIGAAYPNWARRCKIMLAPVNTEVIIDGRRQPGDEDTTRTYELAAAHCFFLHRRTPYVESIYDENSEVPLYDGAEDLAHLIAHYLDRNEERFRMAGAAHRRAVPAHSTHRRASAIADLVRERIGSKRNAPGNI